VIFGRPFLTNFAPCYQIIVYPVLSCLSVCLSVTLVYCGQTVDGSRRNLAWRWPRFPPHHIVLDGDPAAPKKAQSLILGPRLSWLNGWIDQDATWYGGSPKHRRHCGRWGPISTKKSQQPPPLFRPMYCGQTVDGSRCHWYRGRPRSTPHWVRWGPSTTHTKWAQQPPIFSPCLLWPNG